MSNIPDVVGELYPFKSHFLDIGGHKYHYIDEGSGETVLMVHGNPTWSFFYRNIIKGLSSTCRCIALDHMGCGLSDKPYNYPYTLSTHIYNLEVLIQELELKDITLIVHDWGGPIGIGCALRHQNLIKRLVIMNTAAFLNEKMPFRIAVCRGKILGHILVRFLNLFLRASFFMAVAHREKMTPAVKAGYLFPYRRSSKRIAILRFIQDIPIHPFQQTYSQVMRIEQSLQKLRDIPKLLLWGEKDFCFTTRFLKRWQSYYSDAAVKAFSDAGHYLLEDVPDEALQAIQDFIRTSSSEAKHSTIE